MSLNNITVVDSVMGKGKSSAAIEYINEHEELNFVVVTLTQAECQRYAEGIEREVIVPHLDRSDHHDTLVETFIEAIDQGKTVVTTHALLKRWDEASVCALKGKDYVLILDEVLDVVQPFQITKQDYHNLVAGGTVSQALEADTGLNKVVLEDAEYEGKHAQFIDQVRKGNVYRVKDDFCIWLTSPTKLTPFNEVYILTYNFEGSVMAAWLKLNGLDYSLQSVTPDRQFGPYQPDTGVPFDHLITIVRDPGLNDIGKRASSLSKTWYEKSPRDRLERLRNATRAFFRRYDAEDPQFNMWSTYKDHRMKIQYSPFGFIRGKVSKNQMKHMTAEERAERDTFVSFNMKATNVYGHKACLAYLVNVYANPSLTRLFSECGLEFDEEQYALNELIQWIWRSRIRRGESVLVYIPSKRMRSLLDDWLSGAFPERQQVQPREAA